MSIYGTLAGLMNIEARTSLLNNEAQDYAVLAQERQLNVQARQQQQRDEMQYHQALMDTMQGNVTKIQDGQVVDAGDPLVSGLGAQLKRDQQSAASARKLADAMQNKVSLPYYDKLDKDAREADRVATTTANAYRQAQSDLAKKVGSIAGSATDDDTFRQAYRQIAEVNPQQARSLNVDRDVNGIPFYGPQSKKSMDQLQRMGMTASEQIQKDVNVANEARKEDELARKKEDDVVKNQEVEARTAYYRQQSATSKSLEDKRREDEVRAKQKSDRLQGAATKPATTPMIDVARKDILSDADFKDKKFDETSLGSFAAAVADRANKIRAESDRAGEAMDYADARQQAISELKQYVKPATVGQKKLVFTDINIPGTGEEKFVYQRGGAAPAQAGTADEQQIAEAGKKMNDAGLDFKVLNGAVTDKSGAPLKVMNKVQYDSLPSGTKFIGPDGKPWTKP